MKYYNLINVGTIAQSIEVRKKLEESGYSYRSNTDLPEDFVLLLKIKFPGLSFVRVNKVCSPMKYKIYFIDYIWTIGLKDDHPIFSQDYTGKHFTLIDEDEAVILRLKHPGIKLYQLSKDDYEV